MVIQASNPMSRRNFCLCCLASTTAVAAGGWLTPSQAFAQARAIVLFIKADAASAEIAVHRLRRNVTVLQGSGGNIAVLTGDDGKLLIDAGIAVSRPQITAALASLGAEPIRHLINTHWHFDHADGNAWIHAAGATILAHENTRNRLLATQYVEDWKTDFPPPVSGAIPTDVFADARTVHLNDTTIALKYYGPAHTDCDISVFFTEADVLHTGDIFWNGFYPFIDYSTGGSIDGTIRAADASLAVATDTMIIVPGHGPSATRLNSTCTATCLSRSATTLRRSRSRAELWTTSWRRSRPRPMTPNGVALSSILTSSRNWSMRACELGEPPSPHCVRLGCAAWANQI
jgi:glyoxylase-like metal-dependent hydrolase (beta-lactamase superfamily II)